MRKGLFSWLINTKLWCLALLTLPVLAQAETLMLQQPDISKTQIAFVYAGDIYVAARDGKNSQRLTSHPAMEQAPHFSPDGKTIAFTANYDGNNDVYLINVEGGQPRRLTWHPSRDTVVGWHPQGQSVVFMSAREMASGRSGHLYQIETKGGFPEKVMQALAFEGSYNHNGKLLAYRPYRTAHIGASGWRNHRGGSTPPIWIMDLAKNSYTEIPHENASDTNPMWIDEQVYFLSDRDKTKNLYSFAKGKLKQITQFNDWDIDSANVFDSKIIYAKGTALHILDTKSAKTTKLSIDIKPDLPQLRPQWKNAMQAMTNSQLSSTGKRVLISGRGEVFTVPVKDGSTRNITNSSGVNERDALWSPKGQQIAYISDQANKQKLVIAEQSGKVISTHSLGDYEADFSLLHWSADNKNIVYADSNLVMWALNSDSGKRQQIAKQTNMLGFNTAVSFDGDWLAYTKSGQNYLWDLYLYQFSSQKTIGVTDGLSHNDWPAFSRDGQYLYFASSTNAGPSSFGLDLSTQEKPQRFGLYAAVLQADGKSPLLPKAGDESTQTDADGKEGKKDQDDSETAPEVKVDAKGLTNRIVALPVPKRFYSDLAVADDGMLYFLENTQAGASIEPNGRALQSSDLLRFNAEDKKVEDVLENVERFTLSADGKQALLGFAKNKIKVSEVAKKFEAKDLDTSDVKALIDPKQEWLQIFNEAWRNERDYFYDPNIHGLDWADVYKQYRPLLDHVGSREDLNWLMVQMISEMEVGHNRIYGGDLHQETFVPVGLLGADIRLQKGQYVVDKIYTGESWNPFVEAPLAVPGIDVKEGDHILAINGEKLTSGINFHQLFVNTVGKQTSLTVSRDGSDKNAKTVVVEPISNESTLRNWDWIESNRKKVDELSDGKVGYVYLPNTGSGGFTYFNRMFFAQIDKRAMIIDERRNGGGQAANYITDVLSREYLAGWQYRSGEMVLNTPAAGIYGPKVMLIDQDAGSGGDFLPYSFKRMGLGKLIGKTTWGGLIGISANRSLIDGGGQTVPHFRFFTPDHEWRVENEGVAPDIEVELDPSLVNKGQDAQLQRAVSEVLGQLKTHKPVRHDKAPAFPTKLGM
ncbi:S41 family peptidase [uncultured Paraglaciecola sp.]|uniref:S41 family peptidase n=1 Tax=uncultured Paraglaciecola sp. TaxID=1765024 RepID=UPI00262C1240|nr:S41 family peptidase [uncultured Paraglaciecola sp.]